MTIRRAVAHAVFTLTTILQLGACGDSGDGEPVAGASGSGETDCSELMLPAFEAVNALEDGLGACAGDADCIEPDVRSACVPTCGFVVATGNGDALAEGIAELDETYCESGCHFGTPSCAPGEPRCKEGACVWELGPPPDSTASDAGALLPMDPVAIEAQRACVVACATDTCPTEATACDDPCWDLVDCGSLWCGGDGDVACLAANCSDLTAAAATAGAVADCAAGCRHECP